MSWNGWFIPYLSIDIFHISMDIFHHICLMENPEISSMIYPYLSLFIHWNVRIFHCHEQELIFLIQTVWSWSVLMWAIVGSTQATHCGSLIFFRLTSDPNSNHQLESKVWKNKEANWLYGDGSKPWYLVNPKIAGKWMFIPLKMYL